MFQYQNQHNLNSVGFLEQAEDIVAGWMDSIEPTPIGPRLTYYQRPSPSVMFPDSWELKRLFPLSPNSTAVSASPYGAAASFLRIEDYQVTEDYEETRNCPSIAVSSCSDSSVSFSEESACDLLDDEFDAILSQLPFLSDGSMDKIVEPTTSAYLPAPTLATPSAKAVAASKPRSRQAIAGTKRSRKFQTGQWNERYRELLLFRQQHGHLFVPHSYPTNQKLAQWVKRCV